MNFKRLVWATTALTGGLLLANAAYAQSSGTQAQEATEVEEVVVTASRGLPTIDGTIAAEQAPKSRSTVTQEFIATQTPGQSILQTVNLVPGVNFTNNDAYGSSGGNLRLRSFDGNRVSLTFDGIPLNDTGNYAIYSNQQLDPELIERASVNLGTTDVDSPTASAAGGTINYTTIRPTQDFGVMAQASYGSDNYRRVFGLLNTGALPGVESVSAWLAGSYTTYDKFKGPGEIEKWQINGRVFWDMGNGDFASLSAHYNENRNAFYRNLTLAQIDQFGEDFDNLGVCTRDAATAGVRDNDNNSATMTNPALNNGLAAAENPAYTASCTNFYGLRINPSDTGNVRGQFRKGIGENLIFTFDPYYQYTVANGGGTTAIEETDARLRGVAGVGGVDLNGDGDILDLVRLYTPNTTNTNRVGVTSSLIWNINDQHRVRIAYAFDQGRHRQTGEYGFLTPNGFPQDVFGGKPQQGGIPVVGLDGNNIQGRDRFSVAELNQWSVEYRGLFLDDKLTLNIGIRAPTLTRELNQYCYSQAGSSNVYCTTETPSAPLPTGYVRFASRGTTNYIAPFSAEVEYEDILPNVGVSYRLADNHVVYVSYAEGLSAPRTDNLYTAVLINGDISFSDAEPEITKSWDLGYRYQGQNLIGSAAIWMSDYENRIVSSYDDELAAFVDRNIGNVELWGIDSQIGWQATEELSLYASASYTDTELQDNIAVSATGFVPTKGKELVETPEWTFALRAFYDTEWFSIGADAKYVDERWATDVNDEKVDDYTLVNLDARFKLDNMGWEGSYVQLNVFNLFDEDYLGSISSRENAVTIPDVDPVTPGNQSRAGSAPTYAIGAPRTVTLTLRARF